MGIMILMAFRIILIQNFLVLSMIMTMELMIALILMEMGL